MEEENKKVEKEYDAVGRGKRLKYPKEVQKQAALPRRKISNTRVKRALCKDYLLANPYATTSEVLQAIRCSIATVTKARNELRAAGHAKVQSLYDRNTPRRVTEDSIHEQEKLLAAKLLAENTEIVEPEEIPTKTTAQLMDIVEEEAGTSLDDITPAEMRRVITKIIKNPGMPPQVRLAAISKKMELDYATQSKHDLGPGAPLTRIDAIERLANLMKACGSELVDAAITQAFGTATTT